MLGIRYPGECLRDFSPFYFWHAVLQRPRVYSRTFGCGTSKGAFGTLRHMSGSRPSFPVDVNGKPSNSFLFSIARSNPKLFCPLRYFTRCTVSAQRFLPLLLYATMQLHTAGSSKSSTALEHHTYVPVAPSSVTRVVHFAPNTQHHSPVTERPLFARLP